MSHKFVKISLNVSEQKREDIELISDYYKIPRIEGVSKKTIITGRNRVNLFSLSCSCKDHRLNVAIYPKRDIRRICKHLYAKLFSDLEDKLDELTKLLLHNQFWFGQTQVKKIFFYGDDLYIGFYADRNFISIYKKNEKWHKYIFDTVINEWKDLNTPFDQYELNKKLVSIIKQLDIQRKTD